MSVWRQNHFLLRSRMYFLKITITLFLAPATDWPSPVAVFREWLWHETEWDSGWVWGTIRGDCVLCCHKMSYSLYHFHMVSVICWAPFSLFPFSLCLFINTRSRLRRSSLGQSPGLRMGETIKTQISSCFISVSQRTLVSFGGRSMCLYSRRAWGCIIVVIVLESHRSANGRSTENHKYNWPQLASCCCPGRVYHIFIHTVILVEEKIAARGMLPIVLQRNALTVK